MNHRDRSVLSHYLCMMNKSHERHDYAQERVWAAAYYHWIRILEKDSEIEDIL